MMSHPLWTQPSACENQRSSCICQLRGNMVTLHGFVTTLMFSLSLSHSTNPPSYPAHASQSFMDYMAGYRSVIIHLHGLHYSTDISSFFKGNLLPLLFVMEYCSMTGSVCWRVLKGPATLQAVSLRREIRRDHFALAEIQVYLLNYDNDSCISEEKYIGWVSITSELFIATLLASLSTLYM